MDDLQETIIIGFRLLQEKKRYQSIDILGKLETLDRKISASSFSNIINKGVVGIRTLQKVYEGIINIIESELCYKFEPSSKSFSYYTDESWVAQIIPLPESHEPHSTNGINFYDRGRLTIDKKVAFMKNAQHEVVEFGLRLRTFINYFNSRSQFEFAYPIKSLLSNGINFKLYLLDPNCNEALLYFNDRAKQLEEEFKSVEIIKEVISQFHKLALSLQEEDYSGKFEVFTYKHIPYNHFLIIDGNSRYGEMMVSNYLYGIKRADCPVIGISKQNNGDLFRRYYKSYKLLSEGARSIV